MRFGVLGPLAVWTDQGEPVAIPGGRVRTLLADLLVHAGRPVSADRLIDDLWGEQPPRDAAAALQVKVSQLRRALAAAEPDARHLVVSRAAGYLLEVAPDAVDAGRFEALVTTPGTDPRSQVESLDAALRLWRGAALADIADEEFALAEIARLEELRLTAVEAWAQARLELGEHAGLIADLSQWVTENPLRERLRAAQLRALYRSGRQSEALAGYTEFRTRLDDELGIEPGPELAAVQRAILAQDPALDATTAAASPPGNLPEPLSDLIGREEAVHRVRALLSAHRLVTLTGPGGVGKTSLAVEIGRRLTADYRDGTWLVELAGLDPAATRTATIADVVAAVLGIRNDPQSSGSPTDHLAAALRGKQLLLVLDNCEHLVDAVAELAAALLKSNAGLRILATSQEPLRVSGELVEAVPPLESPHSPAETGIEALRKYSAVRLFVARAAAAAPGFVLNADNASAVAAISRRLDGIPLALELAATRVRVLGVRQLAARMDERFDVLVAGQRGAPSRQQTLRAMIDWSWEQLDDLEKVVLRRLSVHADGVGLTAAERICADDELPVGRIVDLLARLVDRSLVLMVENEAGPRYRMLESVTLYGQQRLAEAGEADRVRDRRNDYFTELAEHARLRLRGAGQRRWLAVLAVEYANLRAAVVDSAQRQRADIALRLVDALSWYWYLRGRIDEGIGLLTVALEPNGTNDVARARARGWVAAFTLLGNDNPDRDALVESGLAMFDRVADPIGRAQAEWLLSEALLGGGEQALSEKLAVNALAAFRAVGDRWGTAAALGSVAHHALIRGDIAGLGRDAAESASHFHDLGDRWGQLRVAALLARRAEIIGDYPEAARLRQDGLRRAEELGMWSQVAEMLAGLGRLALLDGKLDRARQLHERGRDLAAGQGNQALRVFAEVGLGIGARREGRLNAAEEHTRTALAWNQRVGYAPGIAQSLAELGFIAELRGDSEVAWALHQQGLEVARNTGDPRAIALATEGLAGAAALASRSGEAADLLAAAAAARESVGAPLPSAERDDVDRITAMIRGFDPSSRA